MNHKCAAGPPEMEKGKRKRKSYLILFLAVILAVCMLCGCQGAKGSQEEDLGRLLDKDSPVTITIWHYYNGVQQIQFDDLVSRFNDTVGSEQGIVVEANSKTSVDELADSVLASVKGEPGADEMPDIFGTYAETAYQIDKLGKLADIRKYFTEEELDEYVKGYIEEGAFSGEDTLKIFPIAKSTEVMMVNSTDWEKFAKKEKVSYEDLSTWEGLVDVAEKYYQYTDALTPDEPNDGKSFFGRDSVANYLIVGAKQLGHEFAAKSQDGTIKPALHKETVKKLWECFYVPYVKGYFTAESKFRSDDAKIGSIIAMVCSTTGAAYYPEEVTIDDGYSYPIENVSLPVPNFEGCDPCVVQQGAGMSVMKSNEKKEYACVVFLKWFTQEEQNIQFAVKSGYLPVKEEANDYEAISSAGEEAQIGSTMLNTLKAAIDEIHTYSLYTSPPYDQSAQVREYIGSAMENTAKEAYAAAQEKIAAGGEREAVLEEFTNDKAFDAWYSQFEQGFYQIGGEESGNSPDSQTGE